MSTDHVLPEGRNSAGIAEGAFYAPSGAGRFRSNELTRGPWDAESQHAGPPAALLARAIERCPGIGASAADRLVGRITFEILKPVPIAPLEVEAEVVRPGRRVDLVEAALRSGDGEELVAARAWRIRAGEVELPGRLASAEPGSPARAQRGPAGGEGRPVPPERLEPGAAFFPTGHEVGYHVGMEYRFAAGGFLESGPAVCWMRMRGPLVAGEEPSPLQRVLVAADSGNGISATLDFRRYLFINVDLTAHLHRMPVGEWVCLDSLTVPEPTGIGFADSLLWDERGPIGRACQTLLVAER
jgi:hypothetical protein